MKKIFTVLLLSSLFIASAMTVSASSAVTTRNVPTSGGNRNVTWVEINLNAGYEIRGMSAQDSFGRPSATLAEFAAAIPGAGADTVVFPVNLFVTQTFEIVGAVYSQGRTVSAGPQPWLNYGVGFTQDNRMSMFSGRIDGDFIYGEHWDSPRYDYVTAFNPYPRLIVGGQRAHNTPTAAYSQSWMDGRVNRAFMGQRADGTFILGNVNGTSIRELQDIAEYFNLVNAVNIDGGASAGIWRNGSLVTTPGRQLASVMVITGGTAAPQIAASQGINVTIDGIPVVFAGQGPVTVHGRTLVPVRGVFERLGFDVNWNGELQQVTLSSPDYTVVLTIGSSVFSTNGVNYMLDVPAQTIGGSTMLPIRAVLESVGYSLTWDDSTSTVRILSP